MAEEAWGEESTWDQPEAEAPAAEDTTLVPAADNAGGANEFPDAAPKIVEKTLEELKDEAGAWTLASDESVSAPVACLFTNSHVPLCAAPAAALPHQLQREDDGADKGDCKERR